MKSLGQIAYEAWDDDTGFAAPWDQLPVHAQQRWHLAAVAIVDEAQVRMEYFHVIECPPMTDEDRGRIIAATPLSGKTHALNVVRFARRQPPEWNEP